MSLLTGLLGKRKKTIKAPCSIEILLTWRCCLGTVMKISSLSRWVGSKKSISVNPPSSEHIHPGEMNELCELCTVRHEER